MRYVSGFFLPALARTAVVLVVLGGPATAPAQAILAHDVIDPRTFGYVIGDKIRREVRLTVRPGYRLDETTLPKAGRVDRWLELAAPELRSESVGNGRRYRLVLIYQIFNAPRALAAIRIPQQDLRLIGRTQSVTTLIPALEITVAPLTGDLRAEDLRASALQQDRLPAPLPVESRQMRLAWTGVALLALLLLAIWRRAVGALSARRNLPFARAVRQLQRLQRLPASGTPAEHAAALKIVHGALNRTAGRAVFAHNLGAFLAAHPGFAGLRADFERLFAASGRVFFADAAADTPCAGDPSELLRLCRRCSRIERRSNGRRTATERQSFEARASVPMQSRPVSQATVRRRQDGGTG